MSTFRSEPIGQHYRTTDGIEWQIRMETSVAIYPYRHNVVEFIARPTFKGEEHPAYIARRHELGDDWSRCLTDSAYLTDHLIQAGLSEEEAISLLTAAHRTRAVSY